MSSMGRGRKTALDRGLPSTVNKTVSSKPPEELEPLAARLWEWIVEANTELPAARSVTLALLCTQLAELSRLRASSNAVEDLNMTSDKLKQLSVTLEAVGGDPEARAAVSEQRRILVAIRDSAIKRQAAEQNLVLSITKLEEELGIADVKLEDKSKVNLAVLIEQGSYRSA